MAGKVWFPPLRAESDKLRNLDLLRLLAAYGVVLQHFRGYVPTLTVDYEDNLWFPHLFVDLFFTISGFVICFVYFDRMRNWSDYGGFMKRRAARLVPLHWLTLFAFAAIGVSLVFGVQVKEPGKYDWQCFLPSLSMLHSLGVCRHLAFNYASWSISAEMLLYLLFPLFCVVARRGAWILVTAAVAVVVWLTASDLDSYSTEKFWVTYTQSGGFVRAIPSFLMGMCLYAWRAKLSRLPRPELAMYASLIMFLALGFAGTPPFILLPVIYLLAATAVSADMQGKISALPARLSVGGQLTYSVYMLHPLAGTALIAFVGERLLHLGPGALLVWSLMVAVLVGVSAYLSFTFFETPMRRWISGWNFSGSRRAASRQI